MRSYLIVANQTLTSRSLADAITERLADGPDPGPRRRAPRARSAAG